MPELPEVEVVRRGVATHVVGQVLTDVRLSGHRVARRHPGGPDDLAARLEGRLVVAARRRGKYLWLDLAAPVPPAGANRDGAGNRAVSALAGDDSAGEDAGSDPARAAAHGPTPDEALVVHLGMSGQLLVASHDAPPAAHQHGTFGLAPLDGPAGAARRELRFVDQRTFGGLALAALVPDPADATGAATVPESVAHIAPDLFDPAFDRSRVVAALTRRDSAIKRALLDQSLVSGIGNIYADEALWAAGVHGERPCSRLTRPVLGRVLDEARSVMARALDAGGTSFDSLYVDVEGASGYFARSLHAYGRAGQPCHRCDTPLLRESFMNRSSFSCPRCQPRPRAAGAASAPRGRPAAPRSGQSH